MARTIEFEGRTIEVPDDATDDEVATIISATPGPTTATMSVSVPVADRAAANTARSRLSRRDLTPEKIKSGKYTDPGFEYKPRTRDGGYWSNLGHDLNPKNIAAGMGERTLNQVLSLMDPTGGPDSLPPDERSNSGLDMTDLGVPDLPGIYQEANRRGEQGESLAGMYGSATAQGLLSGAGLLGGRLIRAAPARAAAAEAEYAEATGAHGPTFGPRPISSEMLDRGIVVSANPAEKAATYRGNAAVMNAERAAIPGSKAVRGSTGRLQPSIDPVDMANAARRSALRSQAATETNISKILEAIPETQTLREAIAKGGGRFAKSRVTMASGLVSAGTGWSPASLMSLGPVAVTHLLWSISKELAKTNQWRTALPIYKLRFANALMVGDADLAAATGALIASGKAAKTEETHTRTSTSLTPTP